MANSTRSLSVLPNELIEEVLMNVPDLRSIHLASRTCKQVYNVYQASQLKIIRSTILRIPDRPENKIYDLLQILQFVIKQGMVQRDVALLILQDAWKLFAEKKYEQLLIPFGMALAWSYASVDDAIRLLKKMWNQTEPFCLERPEHIWSKRPLTLLPVKMLLNQLRHRKPPHSAIKRFREDVPVAVFRPESKVHWYVTATELYESSQTELVENGVLFKKELIVIKFSPVDSMVIPTTPTLTMRYDPMRYQRYRPDSRLAPNTMHRADVLAHRLNITDYVNAITDSNTNLVSSYT